MTRILLDATELEDLARLHRDAAAELEDISTLLGGLVADGNAVPASSGLDGPLADLRRQILVMRSDYEQSSDVLAQLAAELRSHVPLTRLLRDMWNAPLPPPARPVVTAPLGYGIDHLRRLAGAPAGGVADLLRLAHG